MVVNTDVCLLSIAYEKGSVLAFCWFKRRKTMEKLTAIALAVMDVSLKTTDQMLETDHIQPIDLGDQNVFILHEAFKPTEICGSY